MTRKPNKQHDKQKEVTAASFKRIAKDLRRVVRTTENISDRWVFKQIATTLDREAARLRFMR